MSTAGLTVQNIVHAAATGLLTRSAAAVATRVGRGARRLRDPDAQHDLRMAARLSTHEFGDAFDVPLAELIANQPVAIQSAISDYLQGAECFGFAREMLTICIVSADPKLLDLVQQSFVSRFVANVCSKLPQDQLDRAAINDAAVCLHAFLQDECTDVGVSVQMADSPTRERLTQLSGYAIIADTLAAIAKHAQALSGQPEVIVSDDEFTKLYLAQCHRMHGSITLPDFDRRRDVPLIDLYVTPEIHPRTPGKQESLGFKPLTLDALWDATDRTVLLGDPGGGKSTSVTALLYKLSDANSDHVPFLVTLRDYAQHRDSTSVVEYIEQRLNAFYQAKPPPGYVARMLLAGRGAVFFDGLDELLETSARRDVTDHVQNFSARFPLAPIFVTSRSVGYEQAPMNPAVFSSYTLANFSASQVADYAQRWFAIDDRPRGAGDDNVADLFLRESAEVADLRRNPLMLSLMCILYRGQNFIPKNRPAVYERCATMLFDTWDRSRKIAAEEYLDEALKHLALWMLLADSAADGVERELLISETADYLVSRAFEDRARAERAAVEFVDHCKGRAWVFSDAGTTANGDELYKFTHRTFMEYFAAYELTRRAGSPEKLARDLLPRVAREEWDMVGQLAVQIANKQSKDGSERALAAMLGDKRRRTPINRQHVLAFMARCLTFVNVSPNLTRMLSREIWSRCASGEVAPYSGSCTAELMRVSDDLIEYVADEARNVFRDALSTGNSASCLDALTALMHLSDFARPWTENAETIERQRLWSMLSAEIVDEFPALLNSGIEARRGLRQKALRVGRCTPDHYKRLNDAELGDCLRLDFAFVASPVASIGVGFAPVAFVVINNAVSRFTEVEMAWVSDVAEQVDRLSRDASAFPLVSKLAAAGMVECLEPTLSLMSSDFDRLFTRDGEFRSGHTRAGIVLALSIAELYVADPAQFDAEAQKRWMALPAEESKAGGLLLRARAGDGDARAVLSRYSLPQLVSKWTSGELDILKV